MTIHSTLIEKHGKMFPITRMGDLVSIRPKTEDADFWLIRRGAGEEVGRPTHEYGPDYFGVTVMDPDIDKEEVFFYFHSLFLTSRLSDRAHTSGNGEYYLRAKDIRDIDFKDGTF